MKTVYTTFALAGLAVMACITPRVAAAPINFPDSAIIKKVNRDVNSELYYLTDMENYGVEDLHVIEPEARYPEDMSPLRAGKFKRKYGDCEDYALTKAFRLVKKGISQSRLKPMIVRVPNRPVLHAVLVVSAQGSEPIVLDSYDNIIYTQNELKIKGWEFIAEIKMGNLAKIIPSK